MQALASGSRKGAPHNKTLLLASPTHMAYADDIPPVAMTAKKAVDMVWTIKKAIGTKGLRLKNEKLEVSTKCQVEHVRLGKVPQQKQHGRLRASANMRPSGAGQA